MIALMQLRDFYLEVRAEEKAKDLHTPLQDLLKLVDMPVNLPDRVPLERSSTYIGLKLLWATRLFLLGIKFPKGNFHRHEWRILTHDICDLITQNEYMETFLEIDPSAYFQILTIVFNNPSPQWTFINEPRPESPDDEDRKPVQMSHDTIV